ncbi:MAG TPA: oligopeptide transporter, OPT family [Thermoanaerobaculia bacterium]|jgi:putative OPT family oligopeptide transporter|nr:oligopeptide transporter, OPT family [Thermoanaerobaculia bacterium]
MDAPETKSLPENAYRPLAPGEIYAPIVPAVTQVEEATFRSIGWGLFLCIVFTIASAYSGLKVGQVMEASIPISILAIGLARTFRRRSTLLENVILTNIGGTSGGMVAGAIFTLPALYILHLDPHPVQTTFILLAGGCLGVLFLIPLRRYFVRETHGEFPFPEATAITEVLVTGEKGGSQAKLLLQATAIAGLYDFFVTTFQVWQETVDFQFIPAMKTLADRARVVVRFDAISFILGLGYVMGLRSSMILCAGGFFSNFVLVPLLWMIGQHLPAGLAVYPGTAPLSAMDASLIFRSYVRFVAVGAIATAGIFGIIKSLRIVVGSFSIAAKAFKHGEAAGQERTDRDMPIMTILIGVVISAIGAGIFFTTLEASLLAVLVGLLLTLVFSFFFASVAANAIATIARNPVSGMTMLTIIVSSVVLLRFGLSGTTGMFFVMAIAGMVCTALSVSGQTITDLKAGYWLGSTPAVQERVKFLGILASAVAAALTIVLLAKTFQFGESAPGDLRVVLASPQASIMKALVQGFMSRQPIAYVLFGAGAVIALMMEMLGAPALIFALGMYLPLELNTPALVGGFISHWLTRRSERVGGEEGRTILERGVIIASGLMAGGALGGVFGAGLRLFPWYKESLIKTPFFDNAAISQIVSLVLFLGLCAYMWYGSLKKDRE